MSDGIYQKPKGCKKSFYFEFEVYGTPTVNSGYLPVTPIFTSSWFADE